MKKNFAFLPMFLLISSVAFAASSGVSRVGVSHSNKTGTRMSVIGSISPTAGKVVATPGVPDDSGAMDEDEEAVEEY